MLSDHSLFVAFAVASPFLQGNHCIIPYNSPNSVVSLGVFVVILKAGVLDVG